MISRPPTQNLAEPRLNSSAQFSFSRRRLSWRSLTSRVNYGLCYQLARRLDAVGRVKIQGGPIGAGWSIGYRGTANEKITCLALSAGFRNRNRLDFTFLFSSFFSFKLFLLASAADRLARCFVGAGIYGVAEKFRSLQTKFAQNAIVH